MTHWERVPHALAFDFATCEQFTTFNRLLLKPSRVYGDQWRV